MILREAFPDWTTNTIFDHIQNPPWPSNATASLNLEYFGNRSGGKIVSPLVDYLCDGQPLTTPKIAMLATDISNMFKANWTKQYATLSAQYNPIQNYDMTETLSNDVKTVEYGHTNIRTDDLTHTRTDDLTHTQTDDLTITRTDDLTHTKNGTETQTPDLTDSTDNAVYGFNSSDAVPTGQQQRTSTGTNETEYDLTDTDSGTVTTTDSGTVTNTDEGTVTNTEEGTVTDAESGTDTHRHSYTLTRSGNIGVTTSQQMIEAERDLWMWNFFRDVVFPDVDKVLTIKIY